MNNDISRRDALALGVDVRTFDNAGKFTVGSQQRAPAEMDVDYVWLSSHINTGGHRDTTFKTVLE